MSGADGGLLAAAAQGILARLGRPAGGPAHILYAEGKRPLAEALLAALCGDGAAAEAIPLPEAPDADPSSPTGRAALQQAMVRGSLVILADPPQAPWLRAALGPPERYLLEPATRLYCDWLMPYGSLLRVLSADYGQVQAWRRRLLDALKGAARLRVRTATGTDLALAPRDWLSSDGEVFTAPHEASIQGAVAIDGALYDRPPSRPILLRIAQGRVANLEGLERADPYVGMLLGDLTRDGGAAQVAEFGLGVNPAARAEAHIMEAEMALGTCHVGFGRNLPYGGANASAIHVDVGLLRPTIVVDGRTLCRRGAYVR